MSHRPLNGISRTLSLTLRARADEHLRSDRLFTDPYALKWSTQFPFMDDYDDLYTQALQTGFAVRTRIFDDEVRAFCASRKNPLIIEMGAGLSTRYQRLNDGHGDWLEVDLPEVIALRRALDRETTNHRFLPHSILDPAWVDALPRVAPVDVLFIAEGVLVFLDEVGVREMIVAMRALFPGATFLCDVAGGLLRTRTAPRFKELDAPMNYFVEHERELSAMGLAVQEVWPLLEQYPERWGKEQSEALPQNLRASGLLVRATIGSVVP